MRKTSLAEIVINKAMPVLTHALAVIAVLVTLSASITKDKFDSISTEPFEISFQVFSPAFAAFEDEFLFEEQDGSIESSLIAGHSSQLFDQLLNDSSQPAQLSSAQVTRNVHNFYSTPKDVSTQVNVQKTSAQVLSKTNDFDLSQFLNQFDGDQSLNEASKAAVVKKQILASALPKKVKSEELAFGSLAAMVTPDTKVLSPTLMASPSSTTTPSQQAATESVKQNSASQKKLKPNETLSVSGQITLKDGLAFLGSMEVSWVVGDYELQVGSINTPDGTYEIEVSKLIGDVIISLYDSNDELMGEGLLDLTQVTPTDGQLEADIEIHPVDWNTAGKVIASSSMGLSNQQPLAGVDIALYAFNEATATNAGGEFGFYNWKKTNSRTLAIASKKGYADSIFMLDSKSEAQVLLFEQTYLEAFYSYLKELGIYDVADKGTVYGQIQGVSSAEGYIVRLDKAKTIYFLTSGFASTGLKSTSANGHFSFVGLQDGDYELVVEKDGEILDQRVVVVEQGKVSPITVDLKKVTKHIEFFDPMDPDRALSHVEVSFFDGATELALDRDQQIQKALNKGHDLAVMDFATNQEVNRTLLSRQKGLQKIPAINDNKLLLLIEAEGFSVRDGLIFGFIDAEVPYQVFLAEEEAAKIIYFNARGEIVNNKNTTAHGFIIAGFSQGLSSLVIERVSDQVVLGTDLIYSDHNSLSITHLELLPAN